MIGLSFLGPIAAGFGIYWYASAHQPKPTPQPMWVEGPVEDGIETPGLPDMETGPVAEDTKGIADLDVAASMKQKAKTAEGYLGPENKRKDPLGPTDKVPDEIPPKPGE
ncbi:MAG: hypothetical protein ABI743_13495 [bacterium]